MNYKSLRDYSLFIAVVITLFGTMTVEAAKPKMTIPSYIDISELDKSTPMTITGRTDFRRDSLIRCLLKGKMVTERTDRTELLEVYYTTVSKDNEWLITIPQVYIPVWEGYEIEVSLAKAGEGKEYYYLDVLSPDLPERRTKSILRLWASFLDAFALDAELNKLINSVEEAKQDKPKIDKLIKNPFGVYKTKEEVLADLIKQWTAWENGWLKKLDTLIAEVNKYNQAYFIFPATQERIQQYVGTIKDQYIRYRQRFLGITTGKVSLSVLSHHIIVDTIAWYRNTDEERNNFTRLIAKELTGKCLKDISAWLEHVIALYPLKGGKSDSRKLVFWQRARDYFVKLRKELEGYEKSNTPFSRVSEFHETIDLMAQLTDTLNSNISQTEFQNFILMLKNRLELLYDELR